MEQALREKVQEPAGAWVGEVEVEWEVSAWASAATASAPAVARQCRIKEECPV